MESLVESLISTSFYSLSLFCSIGQKIPDMSISDALLSLCGLGVSVSTNERRVLSASDQSEASTHTVPILALVTWLEMKHEDRECMLKGTLHGAEKSTQHIFSNFTSRRGKK